MAAPDVVPVGSDGPADAPRIALPTTAAPLTVPPNAQGSVTGPVAAEPGTLLASRRIEGLRAEGDGWRVLYTSRDRRGEPIVVSGSVYRPTGDPPAGGWPLVSWAHPTFGVADSCAPSRNAEIPGAAVEAMLRAGYAVAATDYEGLGMAGEPHPYLDGVSAAHTVLDAARVARALPEVDATGPVGVVGYSQGGNAAVIASQVAASYAPDLDVRGVVATAPPDAWWLAGTLDDRRLVQFALFAIAGLTATDPTLDPRTLLTTAGVDLVDAVASDDAAFCPDPNGPIERRGLDAFVRAGFGDDAAWFDALSIAAPLPLPPSVPLLVVHGRGDRVIPVARARAIVEELCRASGSDAGEAGSSTVELREVPGDHDAGADMDGPLTWLEDRLAGAPVATTTCDEAPR
jgi:pimeloyl-ACP methyl ester carboxylesterase